MCTRLCSKALLKHWHILIITDIFPGMFGFAHFRDKEPEAHTYSMASTDFHSELRRQQLKYNLGLADLQAIILYFCFMLPLRKKEKKLQFTKHTKRTKDLYLWVGG